MSQYRAPQVHDLSHGPAIGAASDGLDGIYRGILSKAPSGGKCLVIIDGLDGNNHIECWCRTDDTGSVGNLVLVAFDNYKRLWLVRNLGRSAF